MMKYVRQYLETIDVHKMLAKTKIAIIFITDKIYPTID